MATQPSLNLNRRETCWATLTTIKIHQMREEFGEKMQKPVKTLVRKNVSMCIPIISFCCNSWWLNFHSFSFFTMWNKTFLRILFWMASGFKIQNSTLNLSEVFGETWIFLVFSVVDFYPPSPATTPQSRLVNFIPLGKPKELPRRWVEELPAMVRWSGGKDGGRLPQGIGAQGWKLQDNDIKFPQDWLHGDLWLVHLEVL